MYATLLIIAVFVIGTFLLTRTSAEQHSILFVIRTKHFLRFIDSLSKLSPRLWQFLSDLAVVMSFSGVGAFYLSKTKRSVSLDSILVILSALTVAFWRNTPLKFLESFLILLFAVTLLQKFRNRWADFLFASALITLMAFRLLNSPYLAILEGVFGIPSILLLSLAKHSYQIILGSTLPGISPLVPGVSEGQVGVSLPGYDIFIPWWYALIGLITTLVVHEFAHGVVARTHALKIKSTGLLTLGILPIGAFVEPDEKKLEKRHTTEKMQVFAAGSFANVVVGIAAIFMFLPLSQIYGSFMEYDGVKILNTTEGYPAHGVLENGTIIYTINEQSVKTYDLFRDAMARLKPGDEIRMVTSKGEFKLTAVSSPENRSRAYVGIILIQSAKVSESAKNAYGFLIPAVLFTLTALNWIVFFNINVALVNLMPVYPFDGWRMFKEVLGTLNLSARNKKRFTTAVLGAVLLVLAINILPLFDLTLRYLVESLS